MFIFAAEYVSVQYTVKTECYGSTKMSKFIVSL